MKMRVIFKIMLVNFFLISIASPDHVEKSKASNSKRLLRLKKREMSDKSLSKDKKKSYKLPIVLSIPEFGDMDVPGKKLLDGTLFCIRKMRLKLAGEKYRFSLIGNNNLVNDDGVAQLLSFSKDSQVVIGTTGAEMLLRLYTHPQMNRMNYLFPIDGSSLIRDKQNAATIFYRPPYTHELKALVDYVLTKKFKLRFAILYESGLWGNSLYQDLLKILDSYDIKPVAVAQYQQNTVEIASAVKTITDASPSAVFCLAKPRPVYNFVRQAVDKGMHSTLFLGLSPTISVQPLLKTARGIDIVCTSVVPPDESKIPLILEYKKFFSQRFGFKTSSPFFVEAFLYANLLLEALKNVPQAINQPHLLIEYFESFKNKQILGLPLSFDPTSRSLATKLWISPGSKNPWIEVSFR